MRRIEGSQMLPPGAVIHHHPKTPRGNKLTTWVRDFQFQAKKIDIFSRFVFVFIFILISRVIFPFTFLMFNLWYWSYYLSQAVANAKERDIKLTQS